MSIFLVDEYKDMEPYVPGEQPKDKPYIKPVSYTHLTLPTNSLV